MTIQAVKRFRAGEERRGFVGGERTEKKKVCGTTSPPMRSDGGRAIKAGEAVAELGGRYSRG